MPPLHSEFRLRETQESCLLFSASKTIETSHTEKKLNGLVAGPFVSLTTIFLVDFLGLEKLTNSFGLLSMVRGLASMLGAPIAGEARVTLTLGVFFFRAPVQVFQITDLFSVEPNEEFSIRQILPE